jgi:hypothetical protein
MSAEMIASTDDLFGVNKTAVLGANQIGCGFRL